MSGRNKKHTNDIHKIVIASLLSGFLAACGGGSTGTTTTGTTENIDNTENTDGLDNTLTESEGSSTNGERCSGHTPVNNSTEGNIYRFDVTTGNCFGLTSDDGFRKQVALNLDVANIDYNERTMPDPQLEVSPLIKLFAHNVGLSKSLNVSFEITNNSDIAYCYREAKIDLKDAEGNVVVLDVEDDSSIDGGGRLFHDLFDAERNCLPAGGSLRLIGDEPGGISEERFNSIVSASLKEIRLREANRFDEFADDEFSAEATWEENRFSVTWTNTSANAIKLDDDIQKVWYLDENEYPVSDVFVRLHDGLGIDDTELTDDDFIIQPGETFTLVDKNADNTFLGAARAVTALVYLNWLPVE